MKQIITKIMVITSLAFLTAPSYAQSERDAILGLWYTSEKAAKIKIYKCGDQYCGKIVWLENPTYDNGKPKMDAENPDNTLQDRPLMGLKLMVGFEYAGENEWEDGEIYDPENGKTYACYMNLKENGDLKIVGYIGFSLMGRTEIWTRA